MGVSQGAASRDVGIEDAAFGIQPVNGIGGTLNRKLRLSKFRFHALTISDVNEGTLNYFVGLGIVRNKTGFLQNPDRSSILASKPDLQIRQGFLGPKFPEKRIAIGAGVGVIKV